MHWSLVRFTGSDIRRSVVFANDDLLMFDAAKFSFDSSLCRWVVMRCDEGGGARLWPPFVMVDNWLERLELPGDIGS